MPLCKNCDAPLQARFCSECGQKDLDLDRPLSELLGEVLRETFDVDGRAARTLWMLFRRPGLPTSEFLAGRRRRYTPPFRLYIVTSVLFFVTSAWFVGQGVLLEEGQTLEADAPGQARFIADELPRLMFVLLPVFALLLKAVFRQRLYFEHLIHSLHLHSAAYLLLALIVPLEEAANQYLPVLIFQFALVACLFAGFFISMHRVYRASWAVTAGKALGVWFVYMVLVAGLSEGLSYLTMPDITAVLRLTD